MIFYLFSPKSNAYSCFLPHMRSSQHPWGVPHCTHGHWLLLGLGGEAVWPRCSPWAGGIGPCGRGENIFKKFKKKKKKVTLAGERLSQLQCHGVIDLFVLTQPVQYQWVENTQMKGGGLGNTDWISPHSFITQKNIFIGIRHICQITLKGIRFPGKRDVLVVKACAW